MRDWLKAVRGSTPEKDVAEALGVSEAYYLQIESGKVQKRLDLSLIQSMSNLFNIPVSSIVRMEVRGGC